MTVAQVLALGFIAICVGILVTAAVVWAREQRALQRRLERLIAEDADDEAARELRDYEHSLHPR